MASSRLVSDLDAIFRDPFFSVPVVLGAASTRGVFDWSEVIERDTSGLDAMVNERVLTIRTGTVTLVHGAAITVDGTAYTVRDFKKRDDGNLTDIVLVV